MSFIYYNINPMGKTESDCVCRAISLATNSDYGFIYYLLYTNAGEKECDMLVKGCYRQILEEHFDLKPRRAYGKTVGEIGRRYRDNSVIIRIRGHLTCTVRGNVWDLWDCSDEIADEYWVVT